jgi:hypothetical protein
MELAYKTGLLSDSEIETIQLDLIKLLSDGIDYYNNWESSSVREEMARQIFDSICYTLGIYLKKFDSIKLATLELKNGNLSDILKKGKRVAKEKVELAHLMLVKAESNKLETENSAYRSVFRLIKDLLKQCSLEFDVHEHTIEKIYPLSSHFSETLDLESVLQYLDVLCLENEFCSFFESDKIHSIMLSYDTGYKHLFINIFEQVLANSLGCVLLRKNILDLTVTPQERTRLQNSLKNLTFDDMTRLLGNASKNMFNLLAIENDGLKKYVNTASIKVAANIVQVIKSEEFFKLFVTGTEPENKNHITFDSSRPMSNEDFRSFLEELKTCRYLSDKTLMIRNEIKSFIDLIDTFRYGCLVENELIHIFKVLGDFELALLFKEIPEDLSGKDLYLPECDKKWVGSLRKYFGSLNSPKKEQILGLLKNLKT